MNDLFWTLQLILDLALLAGLGYLLWRVLGRRGKDVRPVSPQDLETFMNEAANLSREFDRILAEKRELIGTTLTTLDSRIARLREMAAKVAQAPPPAAPPAPSPQEAPAPAPEPAGFRAQVLQLAAKGHAPAAIAQALGRPLGEVELVLQLHKKQS